MRGKPPSSMAAAATGVAYAYPHVPSMLSLPKVLCYNQLNPVTVREH